MPRPQPGCPDFETMLWFQVLMFYGYREGSEPDPEDEDLQLIPRLVETVVLPKITGQSGPCQLNGSFGTR